MTTVDIEHLLGNDELLALLDVSEQAGSVKATDLADVIETHELDALEQDALYRELDRRGIEILEEPKDEEPAAPAPQTATPHETTTDALQLFLREAGRHTLLTAPQEVELAKKIEQGDLGRTIQCAESVSGDPDGLTTIGGKFYTYVTRPRMIGVRVGTKF